MGSSVENSIIFYLFFFLQWDSKPWCEVKDFLGHSLSHCKLLKDYVLFQWVVFVISTVSSTVKLTWKWEFIPMQWIYCRMLWA